MRNELVEARDPDTCVECAGARAGQVGFFYANCDGCVARAIAGCPLAPGGLADPEVADQAQVDALKAIVKSSFPAGRRQWAAAAVREWFGVLTARGSS